MAKKAEGSEHIATVLWAEARAYPAAKITELAHLPGMCAYELTNGASHWIFIYSDGVSNIDMNSWESDARLIYAKLGRNGLLVKANIVQSTFVRFNGETLLESVERLPHIVWVRATY